MTPCSPCLWPPHKFPHPANGFSSHRARDKTVVTVSSPSSHCRPISKSSGSGVWMPPGHCVHRLGHPWEPATTSSLLPWLCLPPSHFPRAPRSTGIPHCPGTTQPLSCQELCCPHQAKAGWTSCVHALSQEWSWLHSRLPGAQPRGQCFLPLLSSSAEPMQIKMLPHGKPLVCRQLCCVLEVFTLVFCKSLMCACLTCFQAFSLLISYQARIWKILAWCDGTCL